jgi:hypothetical protein
MNLVAGDELDRSVAEAIGYRTERWDYIHNHVWCSGLVFVPKESPGREEWGTHSSYWDEVRYASDWHPSTDLNKAFAAAERVSDYFVVTKNDCCSPLWECKLSPHDAWCEWVRGATPALAICAAILKLKERTDG